MASTSRSKSGRDGDEHQRAAVVVHVGRVLHETGNAGDDLGAGIQDGLEDRVHGAACAAGHDDLACRSRGTPCSVDTCAATRARDVGVAGIRHVAVLLRDARIDDLVQRLLERGRRLDVGVAEAQVADLVSAVLCAQDVAGLEHPSDPRRVLHAGRDLLTDWHGAPPPWRAQARPSPRRSRC